MTPEQPGAPGPGQPPDIPPLLGVLPLRGGVLFPYAVMPLVLDSAPAIQLVDEAMRTHRLVCVVAQRGEQAEAPGPDGVFRVGSVAMVHQLLRMKEGHIRVMLQGLERVRLRDFTQTQPSLIARVERAPIAEGDGAQTEALARTARAHYQRLVALAPELPDEFGTMAEGLTDARQLVSLLATSAPLPVATRQEILESDSLAEKLRLLIDRLQHEVAVREIEQRVVAETRREMSRAERDAVLRQHLRTIQHELGEEVGGEEVRELRRKLEATALPDEPRREAERELSRLAQLHPASAESGIARTYLDWLLGLPWGKSSGGAIDLGQARVVLDADHYNLEKIKDRILDYLAVRKLRQERSAAGAAGGGGALAAGEERLEPILCFVGPPGVGKTSLGQSIARAMGRRFVRISLGGVHDESEIRGHRRTYLGAMPGRFIQTLRRAETMDPVLVLDEVDKLGQGFHGDPASGLLEVLDPAQNNAFVDTYLGVPVDLSRVLFICTANTVETIPAPLLDRMEVMALSGYSEQEKLRIARRFLLPKQIRANGLREGELELEDAAVLRIIRDYTREAGVRGLERELSAVARKAARRISEGQSGPLRVGAEEVPGILGRPRYFNEVVERVDRPGVVTGLAWTPAGGDVLFVEAAMVQGQGSLLLTGMLGDVMRESAQAAVTYVRSNARRLGIDPRVFEGSALHIHVPAGAIPKDGPSAGVAMMAAVASLARGVPARNDTAMTGEITLRGKVLPVGGIKEKLLAAYRSGLERVILPLRNEAELEDLPAEVRDALELILVDSADEVIAAALGAGAALRQDAEAAVVPPPMH